MVSGGYFQLLGVKPTIGQVFTEADDRAESSGVVISYRYWQRRFGGRADALGTRLTVRDAPLTIVGVTPREFIGETAAQLPDFWLPLRAQPRILPGRDRLHDTPPTKSMWLHVFGRLKPGATPAQAQSQANAIFQSGLQAFYGGTVSRERLPEYLDQRLKLQPASRGASASRSDFSQSLTALLAGVGVLLLMTCTNLASLLLARGTARQTEISIRASLGASRARLVRQLMTESLVLAILGGAAALVVAILCHGALIGLLSAADDRLFIDFSLTPAVWSFIVAVTAAAAVLFGALPAWQVTRHDRGSNLKAQSRGVVGRVAWRSGWLLVGAQLALALPLLVGAGLLVRTIDNLRRVDLGFTADRLLLAPLHLEDAGYDRARQARATRDLLADIQRLPGVRAASFSQLGLFSGGQSFSTIDVEGYTPGSDRDRLAATDVVGAGYFSTLGVPIHLGREILASDSATGPRVCVINEAFAKRYFNQRNPIGLHLTTVNDRLPATYEVVGVVANARSESLRTDVSPRYFLGAEQLPGGVSSPRLLIRTAGDPALVSEAVRRTIVRFDPLLPATTVKALEVEIAPLTAQDRATMEIVVAFGIVALTLAAIGLYGVLSHGVARRTAEIAIRLALGARPDRVVSMILSETVGIVVVGLVAGALLAAAGSSVIGSRLYGVAPRDPLTLAAATALLLVVALSAAYWPARRASRLDPMTALRQDA